MSQKYGFVHPTKTAGSEIRAQLEKDLPMVPSLGPGLGHTPLSEQYVEDVVWIGSVRNPYTRLYSIYNFFNEQWKDLDFISFCLDLERISKLKGEAENLVLTSFEVLSADDTLGVDHIIRFENLDEDIKKLSNALGLETPIVLPPPSHSQVWLQGKGNPPVKGCHQISVSALREGHPNWEFPDWFKEGVDEIWERRAYRQQNRELEYNSGSAVFTRETLDIINKVFDKDFETFGYNKI